MTWLTITSNYHPNDTSNLVIPAAHFTAIKTWRDQNLSAGINNDSELVKWKVRGRVHWLGKQLSNGIKLLAETWNRALLFKLDLAKKHFQQQQFLTSQLDKKKRKIIMKATEAWKKKRNPLPLSNSIKNAKICGSINKDLLTMTNLYRIHEYERLTLGSLFKKLRKPGWNKIQFGPLGCVFDAICPVLFVLI